MEEIQPVKQRRVKWPTEGRADNPEPPEAHRMRAHLVATEIRLKSPFSYMSLVHSLYKSNCQPPWEAKDKCFECSRSHHISPSIFYIQSLPILFLCESV